MLNDFRILVWNRHSFIHSFIHSCSRSSLDHVFFWSLKFFHNDGVLIKTRCSVQSCLFVQSWPRNFLVKCRENLCNAGAAFAATGYYQKINRFKIKIAEKSCYSDDIGFFPVLSSLESLGQYYTEFLPAQCCPKGITTFLNRIFSCEMFPGGSWKTLHKFFYLYNVVPKVLRQHWTGFFFVQCCLEPIGQHCTRFLPVQYCPKGIKGTLMQIWKSVCLCLHMKIMCWRFQDMRFLRYAHVKYVKSLFTNIKKQ